MNKDVIAKMMAQKKKLVVMGEELELMQLNMKELAKFAQFQQKEELGNGMSYLIRTTLQKSMDITDAECDNLKASFVNELIPKVLKMNELNIDQKKEQLPETLPSKKESN